MLKSKSADDAQDTLEELCCEIYSEFVRRNNTEPEVLYLPDKLVELAFFLVGNDGSPFVQRTDKGCGVWFQNIMELRPSEVKDSVIAMADTLAGSAAASPAVVRIPEALLIDSLLPLGEFGPSLPLTCDCGGVATNSTHYSWCQTLGGRSC